MKFLLTEQEIKEAIGIDWTKKDPELNQLFNWARSNFKSFLNHFKGDIGKAELNKKEQMILLDVFKDAALDRKGGDAETRLRKNMRLRFRPVESKIITFDQILREKK